MKLFPFVLILLLCACGNRDLENNIIPSKIVIRQGDFVYAGDHRLNLFFETEQQYPYSGYKILYTKSFKDSRLSITFTGVESGSGVANPASAPASARIILDTLPNGEYDLSINNALLKHEGKLKISDEAIVVDLVNHRGFNVPYEVVRRTPANTYIGFVSGGNVEEFINAFKNLEGVSNLNAQVPGVYSNYTIGSDGRISDSANKFIFQFTGDDEDIEDFITGYGDEMSIQVEAYEGGIIRS